FDIYLGEILSNRQPGCALGKSGVLCRAPLHGSSLRIATQTPTWNIFLERVLDLRQRNLHVTHTDFIAIVKRRSAAQGEQQHCRQACLCRTDPGCDARPVVVSENPVWPSALRQCRLVFPDDSSDIASLPFCEEKLKVERDVNAAKIGAVVLYKPFDGQINFTDQHPVLVPVDQAPHARSDSVHLRSI